MSVRVMAWVWDNSQAEGNDRLVLLAIADCASDDGGNAYPSVATLVRKTRTSERTVQRAIKQLVKDKELTVFPQAGPKGCNRYRVNMTPRQIDTPANMTPPQNDTPVILSPDPRQIDTPDPVKLTPEPSVEPSVKPSESKDLSSETSSRPDVDEICTRLADWIVKNGSRRPNITKAWRDEARRMLDIDKIPLNLVLGAVDWSQRDSFWLKNIKSVEKLRKHYDRMRHDAEDRRRASPATGLVERNGVVLTPRNADYADRQAEYDARQAQYDQAQQLAIGGPAE